MATVEVEMAFSWRTDDDPTLNADLEALRFFRGSRPVFFSEFLYFVIFQGGGGGGGSRSAHSSLSLSILFTGYGDNLMINEHHVTDMMNCLS